MVACWQLILSVKIILVKLVWAKACCAVIGGLQIMRIIGKVAGLLLGLIALYLSATNFQAIAPTADETETATPPYEAIFTHAETMALALTNEMVPTITAYGIDGPSPSAFSKDIAAARAAGTAALEALQALAKNAALPPALKIQFSELQKRADKVAAMRPEIDTDLNGAERNFSRRSILRTFGAMSGTLLTIERLILYTAPATDNAGTAALHLRHNLLVMLYFNAYEAAFLGSDVASGQPISPITKERNSRLNGQIWTAWNAVETIGVSGLFDQSIRKNLGTIQTVFFDEFTDSKFELFDLSEEALYGIAEGEEDVIVDYERTPESWLEIYSTATEPVLELLTTAKAFKPTAKAPDAEEIGSQAMYAILFLGSILLTLLFVVSLFMPSKQPRMSTPNVVPQGVASTPTNVPQLANEMQKLASRVTQLEQQKR